MTFELRPFQTAAVEQLRDAAIEWVNAVAQHGPPKASRTQVIPLLAELTAITGAGKTPILASVIGGLGPSIVFWTTKSSFLVAQTIEKLNDVYRPFLAPGTRIIGEMPGPEEWRALLEDTEGTTIWVQTVASWNSADAAKNTAEAKLSLHRPRPDLGIETSPLEVLSQRQKRARPLWVVYDEGHGQTAIQLDQLIDLNPAGIFAATATPVPSERIRALRAALKSDDVFEPLAEKARVRVNTSEVAKAGLLKTTILVEDLDLDQALRVPHVARRLDELDKVVAAEKAQLRPRALYIVEQSNLKKGEKGESRPVAIWNALRAHGVPASEIAVATDTAELPQDAERITEFGALRPRHRHVIFNKKLQEGWDDPAAYVAYFDGETGSALRIGQLLGRVVRQPGGEHFAVKPLNSAHLFVSAPNEKFERIVRDLQASMLATYGEDEDGSPAIQVETTKTSLPPITVRDRPDDLSLPIWTLAARNMEPLFERLRTEGDRAFPATALAAPGQARALSFELSDEDRNIQATMAKVGQNIQTTNRAFFLERVGALSRQARLVLNASKVLVGPMWEQSGSARSDAQKTLAALAREYVDGYESRVVYVRDPLPEAAWTPREFAPRSASLLAFENSAHAQYPNVTSVFRGQELEFARALDAAGGTWARNFERPALNGYGLVLPAQIGSSGAFYPDFLWWIDRTVWAIDTTGPHLLEAKVRGKLLAIDKPRIALVTPGRITPDWHRSEAKDGWTLVRAEAAIEPRPVHYDDLQTLLADLRGGNA
jgi:type III restriction enzyme